MTLIELMDYKIIVEQKRFRVIHLVRAQNFKRIKISFPLIRTQKGHTQVCLSMCDFFVCVSGGKKC